MILSTFRLVAPVRATEEGRHIESSIGAVGIVHSWSDDQAHSGFTDSNPKFGDCTAWDSQGTYDFTDQAGMTLSWCVAESFAKLPLRIIGAAGILLLDCMRTH